MAKVFVSYSRKDITFAKRLTAELQKCELDFWIDWEGIPPTVDWWREIEKGIEEADIFVFLISPDSAKSKVCGQEIETAVRNGKRIIPIVVRDIAWQDTPKHLGHLNYIFFRESDDFDAAVKKLITAIQTDYEWAATHRRLQIKALDWERNNKDSGFFLRGADLLDAEQDLAMNTSKEPHPTDLQREYVFESRKATDRQRRITTGISTAAAIALAAVAIFALFQANVARERQKIARSGQLSAQAIEIRDRDFQLSLLLGAEGFRSADTVQAHSVLLEGLNGNPLIQYLSGHKGEINTLAYSPDKEILASGSDDGTIIFWDVKTHQPIADPLVGRNGAITQLTFSPDGTLLASGSCAKDSSNAWVDDCRNGKVLLWDVERRRPIGELTGYHLFYDVLAFSPDGKTLGFLSTAYASKEQASVILWKKLDQQPTEQIILLDTDATSLAFSPDGKILATSGTSDGFTPTEITIWDVEKGTRTDQISTESPISIEQMVFKDNHTIIVLQTSLALWDLDLGTYQTLELDGVDYERSTVTSMALSADGQTLAAALYTPGFAGGDDHSSILFWSMEHLFQLGDIRPTGHTDFVNTISFSQDGRTLAFESINNAIALWDVAIASNCCGSVYPPLGEYLRTSESDLSAYTDVRFDPTGKYLAVGMESNEIRVWDIKSQILTNPVFAGEQFVFNKDGTYIAATNGNEITLWSTASQDRVGRFSEMADISALAFSSDGKTLISGHHGGDGILLWKVSDMLAPKGTAIQFTGRSFGKSSGMKITGLAVSPDGKFLAAGSEKRIILWNLKSQQQIKTLSGYDFEVSELVFSSDSKLLAAGDTVKTIVWDVRKMEPVGVSFYGLAFALSPDGRFLAILNSDAPGITQITLWDIPTHQPIGEPIAGNNGDLITSLSYSPDGNMLVSNSADSSIILWNMNPHMLAEAACQRAGRNFTREEWTQYFPNQEYPSKEENATCPQWHLDPEATPTPTP
jgi:WD40 repeat protein